MKQHLKPSRPSISAGLMSFDRVDNFLRSVYLLFCRHSGPQGKVEPLTVVDDPADWKATDWEVGT